MVNFDNLIENSPKIKELMIKLDGIKKNNVQTYLKEIESATERTVICKGKEMIMLASYSYLGLINHPEIKTAAIKAIEKFGTGAGGVRLLSGTTPLHRELETKIAKLKKTDDAVIYSSGYVTNMTFISTLFSKDDLIIIDKFDHQSIYDGCILSKANWLRFDHNNMTELKQILTENRKNYKNVLIVVDAVFSMDGDIAPLPEIIKLAKEFNTFTMVDEAHSLGVLGENGFGIDEYFKLSPGAIDFYMGTFSKSIPSIGGYIAANRKITEALKYASNAFIFSASLPPVNVATAIAAIDIIIKDKKRHQQLKKNIKQFLIGVKKLGFDTLKSQDSAIIPVVIGDDNITFVFAKLMFDAGIFVCPIVYPAVPRNSGRLRCCIMATHTSDDINQILTAMETIGRKLKIIN